MDIKAIPTEYRGFMFRSRLESRWAIFFDTIGIDFYYENQNFTLKGGVVYQPDFYLPRVDMWAEVKPIEFNDQEFDKVCQLNQITGVPVFMLIGPPDFKHYSAIEGIGETIFSLDITDGQNYYRDERRLFSDPPEQPQSAFSEGFTRAIFQSRRYKFADPEGRV